MKRKLSNAAVKQITDQLDGALGMLPLGERRAQQRILHLAHVHTGEILQEGAAFGLSQKRVLALLTGALIGNLIDEMGRKRAEELVNSLIGNEAKSADRVDRTCSRD